MSEQIKPDELLERYVHEIGSRLPSGERKDVMDELQSLLSETIEERSHAPGVTLGTPLVVEMLTEFGSPDEVAARYRGGPQYLIGPGLYPAFIKTLKLIFLIAGIITLVLATLSTLSLTRAGVSSADISVLARWLDVFWSFAWSSFGIAVVVFALIERAGGAGPSRSINWDPLQLPPVEDPNRVSLVLTTFKIYGIVVLFLLFNVFTDRLGILFVDSEQGFKMITLAELGVSFPILWLDIWWLIALARNLFLIAHRRENRLTRWVELGLGLFGAGILYSILKQVSASVDRGVFIQAVGNEALAGLLSKLVLIGLMLAVIFTLLVSAQRIYRLLKGGFRARAS